MTTTLFGRAVQRVRYPYEARQGTELGDVLEAARGALDEDPSAIYVVDGGHVVAGESEAVFLDEDGGLELGDLDTVTGELDEDDYVGDELEEAGGAADDVSVRELEAFITNDADLYRQMMVPIQKNLANKMAAGKWSRDLAVKAFMHLATEGAKRYAKAHSTGGDWSTIFTTGTRKKVAEMLRDEFESEAKLGNYDELLQKKYTSKGVSLKEGADDLDDDGNVIEAGHLFAQHRESEDEEGSGLGGELHYVREGVAITLDGEDEPIVTVECDITSALDSGRAIVEALKEAEELGFELDPAETVAEGDDDEADEDELLDEEWDAIDDLRTCLALAIEEGAAEQVHRVAAEFDRAVNEGDFELAETLAEAVLDEVYKRQSQGIRRGRVRALRTGMTKAIRSGKMTRSEHRRLLKKRRIQRRLSPGMRAKQRRYQRRTKMLRKRVRPLGGQTRESVNEGDAASYVMHDGMKKRVISREVWKKTHRDFRGSGMMNGKKTRSKLFPGPRGTTLEPVYVEGLDKGGTPVSEHVSEGMAMGDLLLAYYKTARDAVHSDAAPMVRSALVKKAQRQRKQLAGMGGSEEAKKVEAVAKKGGSWDEARKAIGIKVSEADLDEEVKVGQDVQLKVGGGSYRGKVLKVAKTGKFQVRLYAVPGDGKATRWFTSADIDTTKYEGVDETEYEGYTIKRNSRGNYIVTPPKGPAWSEEAATLATAKKWIHADKARPRGRFESVDEALGKSDRAVIDAFTDKKSADGAKLTTDGKRLDGNWTGGRGIAEWGADGKIHFNDLGSKAVQNIQRAIAKATPKNWLAEDYDDLDEAGAPTWTKSSLPPIDHEVYTFREKPPKYNTPVSPLSAHGSDGAKMLVRRFPGWTKAQHQAAAKKHEALAAKQDKAWSEAANGAAQEAWGRNYQMTDYRVSGIASSEFSDKWKDKLRTAAHTATKHKDAAHAHSAVSSLRNVPKDESVDEGVPERHQLKIARDTLKMHKAGARIMGGMDHKEAVAVLRDNGWSPKKIAAQLKKAGHGDDDIREFLGESYGECVAEAFGALASLGLLDEADPTDRAYKMLMNADKALVGALQSGLDKLKKAVAEAQGGQRNMEKRMGVGSTTARDQLGIIVKELRSYGALVERMVKSAQGLAESEVVFDTAHMFEVDETDYETVEGDDMGGLAAEVVTYLINRPRATAASLRDHYRLSASAAAACIAKAKDFLQQGDPDPDGYDEFVEAIGTILLGDGAYESVSEAKRGSRKAKFLARWLKRRKRTGAVMKIHASTEDDYVGDDLDEAERDEIQDIKRGMARAMYVDWWAMEQERAVEDGEADEVPWGSGDDLLDVAPATSRSALQAAVKLAKAFEAKNGKDIGALYDAAVAAGGEEDPNLFGHYLAMRALGHGVSWEDSNPESGIKYPDVEYYESEEAYDPRAVVEDYQKVKGLLSKAGGLIDAGKLDTAHDLIMQAAKAGMTAHDLEYNIGRERVKKMRGHARKKKRANETVEAEAVYA